MPKTQKLAKTSLYVDLRAIAEGSMDHQHGRFEVQGLGRPQAGIGAGEAQCLGSATPDEGVSVGAGLPPSVVRDLDCNCGGLGHLLAPRPAGGVDVHAARVLVPKPASCQEFDFVGPGSRGLRNHVCSGVSAVPKLRPHLVGPSGARVPREAAQADVDVALPRRAGV
jgi:hypothetical protein